MGRKYIDMVRAHITNQDLSLRALAPATIARKGHGKYAIDTKRFLRLLKLVTLTDSKHQAKFAAGALQSVKYGRGRTMLDIGRFFNDGTMRGGSEYSPPRQIFTKTLRELLRQKAFPQQLKTFSKEVWSF